MGHFIDLVKEPVFAKNGTYKIRTLKDTDRTALFSLLRETSPIGQVFEIEGVEDLYWEMINASDNSITYAVIRQTDQSFLGQVVLKSHPEENAIETGLDIMQKFQNHGIGSEVLKLVIGTLQKRFPETGIIAKAYSDNERSIHLIRILGGVKVAEEPGEYDAATAIQELLQQIPGMEADTDPEQLKQKRIEVYEFT